MELIYCPNCGKRSGFKRALGFGTFFVVLITLGLWLLAIPFYPARCINCGLTRSSAFWENLRNNPRKAITASSVIAGLVAVFVIFCQYRLKIPHSAGRKVCHPPEKMVESFSRLVENETGW